MVQVIFYVAKRTRAQENKRQSCLPLKDHQLTVKLDIPWPETVTDSGDQFTQSGKTQDSRISDWLF